MTTRLSVGVTRKIGQPNFGSACATCHLEIEIDNSLMNDHAGTLTERIRRTFELCRREVEHELSLTASSEGGQVISLRGMANASTTAKPSRNGQSRPRPATEAQIRAIHAIASKANVKLASELDSHFGVEAPQSLTIRQASELIEKLKRQLTDG